MSGTYSLVGVRVLPPLVALLVASGYVLMEWNGSTLMSASLLGYITGAAWFVQILLSPHRISHYKCTTLKFENNTKSRTTVSCDNRSTPLRITHILAETFLATAILIIWQRLYGAQETGWMSTTLRVAGFFPAVVHMASTQVLLAQPHQTRSKPMWAGLAGLVGVIAFGLSCAIALEMSWLDKQWHGIRTYLLPLVIWQGSACLVAALSHRPFETEHSQYYSFICIGVASLQSIVLLMPVVLSIPLTYSTHMAWFAGISAISLFAVFLWLANIK
jgi:hypothetical protein